MVPNEITVLTAEFLSDHNDGFAKDACRKQLEETKDYITRILNLDRRLVRMAPKAL